MVKPKVILGSHQPREVPTLGKRKERDDESDDESLAVTVGPGAQPRGLAAEAEWRAPVRPAAEPSIAATCPDAGTGAVGLPLADEGLARPGRRRLDSHPHPPGLERREGGGRGRELALLGERAPG